MSEEDRHRTKMSHDKFTNEKKTGKKFNPSYRNTGYTKEQGPLFETNDVVS